MPRAVNRIRTALHYRRECFDEGLRASGFRLVDRLDRPEPGDVLLIWNRYGAFDEEARHFERHGATVWVTENGYLGKTWRGGEWFALSAGQHAGAGRWVEGDASRWDGWGVELAPFRYTGDETVIFGQRGIGSPDVRCPDGWAEAMRRHTGGRIRPHPGTGPSVPLEQDLRFASQCLTWNSGAALIALSLGWPVWCAWPRWIGAPACRPMHEWPGAPMRDEAARLAMFRRLAWAMWTLDEIRTGEPFARLLGRP